MFFYFCSKLLFNRTTYIAVSSVKAKMCTNTSLCRKQEKSYLFLSTEPGCCQTHQSFACAEITQKDRTFPIALLLNSVASFHFQGLANFEVDRYNFLYIGEAPVSAHPYFAYFKMACAIRASVRCRYWNVANVTEKRPCPGWINCLEFLKRTCWSQ